MESLIISDLGRVDCMTAYCNRRGTLMSEFIELMESVTACSGFQPSARVMLSVL
jgi:hypothetical protein